MKKKKAIDHDLVTEEKEEDRPQIVQLKSTDLGEKEYSELRDKEAIETSFSSFGKILFKRPAKKSTTSGETVEASTSGTQEQKQEKISAELDSIFNLSKKEEDEKKEGEVTNEADEESNVVTSEENKKAAEKKKLYLQDEEKAAGSFGLQPVAKKRFVDRIGDSKATNLSAAKVLAREAKSGNKKLLSFYDQEEEENEEFSKECFKEKLATEEENEEDE